MNEIEYYKNKSSTFCMHPFTGLATREDGAVKICCRSLPLDFIQNDSLENTNKANMCTGYMLIKSNDKMKSLYDCVSEEGKKKYMECAFDNNDQSYVQISLATIINRFFTNLNIENKLIEKDYLTENEIRVITEMKKENIKSVVRRTVRESVNLPLHETKISLEYHDELNPHTWSGDTMNPLIRDRLIEIANLFISYLLFGI